MKSLIKFLKDRSGAIAVETAIATPIILFSLLPAIDLGLKVYGKQQLMKATKSGIEYVNMGGESTSEIWYVMNSSYGRGIDESDVSVNAYCGCIQATSQPDTPNGQNSTEDQQYAYVYTKTATQFGANMCPTVCDDGNQPAELVNISVSDVINGIVTSETITTELQTRIR